MVVNSSRGGGAKDTWIVADPDDADGRMRRRGPACADWPGRSDSTGGGADVARPRAGVRAGWPAAAPTAAASGPADPSRSATAGWRSSTCRAAGAQPMVDAELGLTVVFNGCIYNYEQLRDELAALGHRFFSHSDTEVIAQGLRRVGHRLRRALQGHVRLRDRRARHRPPRARAATAWASSRSTSTARPQRLRFASTPAGAARRRRRGHLARPGRARLLHELPLGRAGAAHDPARRPQAAAGDRARRRARRPDAPTRATGTRRSRATPRAPTGRERDWQDALVDVAAHGGRAAHGRRRAGRACCSRAASTRAWSSALLAEAGPDGPADLQHRLRLRRRRVRRRVRVLATSWRSTSAPTTTGSRSTRPRLLPGIDGAIAAMSEPMVSHDCVAFYLLSEEVAQSVKVVQSGQGADEILGRLRLVSAAARRRRASDAVEALRRACSSTGRFAELAEPAAAAVAASTTTRRATFVARAIRAARRRDRRSTPPCATTPTVMLVDDPVKRVDNMTMAWGLEARVPFLDHEFVELAGAHPARAEAGRRRQGRAEARPAAASCPTPSSTGPRATSRCRRSGSSKGRTCERVRDALTDPAARAPRAVPPAAVERTAGRPRTPTRTTLGSNALWQLGLLEMWLQSHGHPLRDVTSGRTARRLDVTSPGWPDELVRAWGCWAPTMTADGRRVAFVSDRNGAPELWVQDVGRTARAARARLHRCRTTRCWLSRWSPDGALAGRARWRPAAACAPRSGWCGPTAREARRVAGRDRARRARAVGARRVTASS